jgi:cytochrome c oxidase assembly protein subunit 15
MGPSDPAPMDLDSRLHRTAGHKPALAVFSAVAAAWVFVLVALGAFTTTIGAGMAFPDWPLSNGSLNPSGWMSNISMFAEHSHRLSAMMMGLLTGILAVWIWMTESRAWLRRLSYFAFGLVVAQGVVGGLRVLLNHIEVPSLETSLGELIAMLHACLAQAFACVLIGIAVSCSRGWMAGPNNVGSAAARAGSLCCKALFLQLAIAAVMRHIGAGLAIPTFPLSTPDGGLLPAVWNFRVGIQFAHRVMALVITFLVVVLAAAVWRDGAARPAMRAAAALLVGLVAFQITLGAAIIRTNRGVVVTTGHVLVGALTLVTAFWITWVAHRDAIESGGTL